MNTLIKRTFAWPFQMLERLTSTSKKWPSTLPRKHQTFAVTGTSESMLPKTADYPSSELIHFKSNGFLQICSPTPLTIRQTMKWLTFGVNDMMALSGLRSWIMAKVLMRRSSRIFLRHLSARGRNSKGRSRLPRTVGNCGAQWQHDPCRK